jgi:hypothetical protein
LQVYNDVVRRANHDGVRLLVTLVGFDVGKVRGYVQEVAGTGLYIILEVIAKVNAYTSTQDVRAGVSLAMVMLRGRRVRMRQHST